MRPFEELRWRGLVQDHTEGVERWLESPPGRVYVGFDPTADSLHVGSLLPLITLVRLQRMGHRPYVILGGATGRIGDPSGKSEERRLLETEVVERNVRALEAQIRPFFDTTHEERRAVFLDNAEWLGSMGLLDFLRDVGKHFSVNQMLHKESVRRRIESEQGISYTEFSYLLLQAYDYLFLFDTHGVTLQAGGSDQWGNITAGIDLIRQKRGRRVEGFTFPLLTTSSGVKFGKTEEGAIWLDPRKTSPFRFHQFWLAAADEDVERYLKMFTFLEPAEIEDIVARHRERPEARLAQRRLAAETTRLVHGEEALGRAERAADVLFGAGRLEGLSVEEVEEIFGDVPSADLSRRRVDAGEVTVAEALQAAGLARSGKEAKRAVLGGAVRVGDRRVEDPSEALSPRDAVGGRVFVLSLGRRRRALVRIKEP